MKKKNSLQNIKGIKYWPKKAKNEHAQVCYEPVHSNFIHVNKN